MHEREDDTVIVVDGNIRACVGDYHHQRDDPRRAVVLGDGVLHRPWRHGHRPLQRPRRRRRVGGRARHRRSTRTPTDDVSELRLHTRGGQTKTIASTYDYENAKNPDQGQSYGFHGLTDDGARVQEQLPPEAFRHPPYTGIVDSHPYAGDHRARSDG